MQKIPMTPTGHEQLQIELKRLKNIERPAIVAAIAEARKHGDLKENAEYHAAKEQQGFIEGRVHELESKLSHCHVIDVTQHSNDGKVIFGATVTLLQAETEQEVAYKIVGEDEANIKQNKISITSPIARAMIGKYVNDEIQVHTPQGVTAYEIIDVEYV